MKAILTPIIQPNLVMKPLVIGGKETKWQMESNMMMAECVEKNTVISDDFRNLQKFVKKIKTLFWINVVILQRKSWTGDVKSMWITSNEINLKQ